MLETYEKKGSIRHILYFVLLSYKSLTLHLVLCSRNWLRILSWMVLFKEGWDVKGGEKSSKVAAANSNQEMSVGLKV